MSQTHTPGKIANKGMPVPFFIMIDRFEEEQTSKKKNESASSCLWVQNLVIKSKDQ